jgi:hypothetical protein
LWLDVDSEPDIVGAAAAVIDTCAVRFAAVAAAVDDCEEERSVVLVGDLIVGLRFGVDVEDVSAIEEGSGADAVEVEAEAMKLVDSVIEVVASTKGIEPSRHAHIERRIDEAFEGVQVDDERVRAMARVRMRRSIDAVFAAIRQKHQLGFVEKADEFAREILSAHPEAASMNLTSLRLLARTFLDGIDRECATRDSGEPIVQAVRAQVRGQAAGLF